MRPMYCSTKRHSYLILKKKYFVYFFSSQETVGLSTCNSMFICVGRGLEGVGGRMDTL